MYRDPTGNLSIERLPDGRVRVETRDHVEGDRHTGAVTIPVEAWRLANTIADPPEAPPGPPPPPGPTEPERLVGADRSDEPTPAVEVDASASAPEPPPGRTGRRK